MRRQEQLSVIDLIQQSLFFSERIEPVVAYDRAITDVSQTIVHPNPHRVWLIIANEGTEAIRIMFGKDRPATTGTGIRLLSGEEFELDVNKPNGLAQVQAITELATVTSRVVVTEGIVKEVPGLD